MLLTILSVIVGTGNYASGNDIDALARSIDAAHSKKAVANPMDQPTLRQGPRYEFRI